MAEISRTIFKGIIAGVIIGVGLVFIVYGGKQVISG